MLLPILGSSDCFFVRKNVFPFFFSLFLFRWKTFKDAEFKSPFSFYFPEQLLKIIGFFFFFLKKNENMTLKSQVQQSVLINDFPENSQVGQWCDQILKIVHTDFSELDEASRVANQMVCTEPDFP